MSEAREIRAAVEANSAFYTAFAAGDLDELAELFATTVEIVCIHPGLPAIHGRHAVLESFRSLLSSPPPPIRASGAQVAIIRGLALVTCLEHIGDSTLAASNLFAWEDGAWRLAHHQAGPVDQVVREAPPPGNLVH